MQVLEIKGINKKILLSDEWYSIDEDVFVKKNKTGIFEMIAVYFLEKYDENANPLFNLVIGEICLDNISIESIENTLDVYGWTYNPLTKTITTDDEEYDKDWSEYLIAEALLNHSKEGNLELRTDIYFDKVIEVLQDKIVNIPQLANYYTQEGKKWLSNEYGDYHNKTTGFDIDVASDYEEFRAEISNEINKLDEIKSVKWTKEEHGYVLWIEFI